MDILPGYKLCRKKLHQYPINKKRCPECQRKNERLWYEKNSDRARQYARFRYSQDPERQKILSRRWERQNPERKRECDSRWWKENPEQKRENSRRWQKQNPDKIRAKTSRYRARKKQATPPWADHAAINAVYAEAVRLEKETGIQFHVDHIYPLTSLYMCGLHVAENLQILCGPENCSKGNRSWPGQLECQRLPLHMNGFEVVD